METQRKRDGASIRPSVALAGALFAALFILCGCGRPVAFQQAAEARQLATTLQAEFAGALEASNRVVMIATDPASSDSAKEAEARRERVKNIARELDQLLSQLQYAGERKLLEGFRDAFATYEVLDAQILRLALEKTNVRATQLAFGPARQAADNFADALAQLSNMDPKTRVHVLEAVLAVRELQTLQAPHIAEPSELEMTRLEERMSAHAAAAQAALHQLSGVTGAEVLQPATAALDRFLKTNAEVVALSRRNTNVRSLELTLGQKRNLIATCDERLRALHEALGERARRPTR